MPPPDDISLLLIIFMLPFLFGAGIYVFFFRRKLHKKGGWQLLLQGNLLIFLMLASLFLLAGESYYRFIYDDTDSFALTNSTNRWILRYYKTNNRNFRDSEDYSPSCPADKVRITFLGDSFTVGHGIKDVEQRFTNLVRRQNPGFEVQVLAGNGMDTGPQLKMVKGLQQQGIELQYVVLVYCLNDLSDIVPEYRQVLDRIYEHEPGYLFYNSYFLNTLYYRWVAFSDPDIKNFYQFTLEAYQNQVWEKQKQRLTDLRDLVEAQGAELLVVTFPFIHALGKDYNYAQVHQQLDAHWDSLHVPHLDLLGTYQGLTAEELRVNMYDAHPNERAHAMAAEAIGAFVNSHLEENPHGEVLIEEAAAPADAGAGLGDAKAGQQQPR